jgi:hypothetical protein
MYTPGEYERKVLYAPTPQILFSFPFDARPSAVPLCTPIPILIHAHASNAICRPNKTYALPIVYAKKARHKERKIIPIVNDADQ